MNNMIGGLKNDANPDNEFEEKKIQRDLALIDKSIKSLLKNRLDDIIDTEAKLETIDCESRDGFIPHSWNKGGYEVSGFILSLDSALEFCNNDVAYEKIGRINTESYETVQQEFMKKHRIETVAELDDELKNSEALQEEFNQDEDSYRDDEAVRFSVRVMYNGWNSEEGHSFTVDSQINWEMPYFRDGKGASAFISSEFSVKNPDEFSSTCENEIKRVMNLFQKKQ